MKTLTLSVVLMLLFSTAALGQFLSPGMSFPQYQMVDPDLLTGRPLAVRGVDGEWHDPILVYETKDWAWYTEQSSITAVMWMAGWSMKSKFYVRVYSLYKTDEYCKSLFADSNNLKGDLSNSEKKKGLQQCIDNVRYRERTLGVNLQDHTVTWFWDNLLGDHGEHLLALKNFGKWIPFPDEMKDGIEVLKQLICKEDRYWNRVYQTTPHQECIGR